MNSFHEKYQKSRQILLTSSMIFLLSERDKKSFTSEDIYQITLQYSYLKYSYIIFDLLTLDSSSIDMLLSDSLFLDEIYSEGLKFGYIIQRKGRKFSNYPTMQSKNRTSNEIEIIKFVSKDIRDKYRN